MGLLLIILVWVLFGVLLVYWIWYCLHSIKKAAKKAQLTFKDLLREILKNFLK